MFQITISQKSHANLTYFFLVEDFEPFLGLECVFVTHSRLVNLRIYFSDQLLVPRPRVGFFYTPPNAKVFRNATIVLKSVALQEYCVYTIAAPRPHARQPLALSTAASL